MIDIAVIGSGPAGLSAAVNGVQRNKSVVVFGEKPSASYLYAAENVDNYLGLPKVSGKELIDRFYNHAKNVGVGFREGKVYQIFSMGDHFTINFDNNFYEAKSVIITTGMNKSKTIEGEEKFLGRGVSYCATCDGMLYRGKTIAVVGETDEAENELKFLSEVCQKVYYIPTYKYKGESKGNVEVLNTKVSAVIGDETVKEIKTEKGTIECDGVFFIKKSVPYSSMIFGLETEGASIKTSKHMETNIKGLYAAGDATGKPYQISKACGEGLVAALSAVEYIDKL
ncbi:MAG: NAD(P)/FAD-dependent oxidoreductase [Lachnospiraceae bacterium]|nr:NAD(P)/FAD-dependent oxidoreductase [Lachnospiraceae bacterium]